MFCGREIFPYFEHNVNVQSDNSLGFKYLTPEDGFILYGGKGNYNKQISLNNSGLRGNGDFTYLTSSTLAEDIIFHPDSLMTNANEFKIQQKDIGMEYPMVR